MVLWVDEVVAEAEVHNLVVAAVHNLVVAVVHSLVVAVHNNPVAAAHNLAAAVVHRHFKSTFWAAGSEAAQARRWQYAEARSGGAR